MGLIVSYRESNLVISLFYNNGRIRDLVGPLALSQVLFGSKDCVRIDSNIKESFLKSVYFIVWLFVGEERKVQLCGTHGLKTFGPIERRKQRGKFQCAEMS